MRKRVDFLGVLLRNVGEFLNYLRRFGENVGDKWCYSVLEIDLLTFELEI